VAYLVEDDKGIVAVDTEGDGNPVSVGISDAKDLTILVLGAKTILISLAAIGLYFF